MNWLTLPKRLFQVFILEINSLTTPFCGWRYAINKWKAFFSNSRSMNYCGRLFAYEDRLTPFTLFTYVNEVGRGLELLSSEPREIRVLEIGANIGGWGTALLRHRPEAELYSFEPNSEPYAILHKNSTTFNSWNIFNCGVAELEEEIELSYISGKSAQGSIYEENASLGLLYEGKVLKTRINVRPLTSNFLSENCGGKHFDFVKIDVEGAEYGVVKGLAATTWDVLYVELSINRKGAAPVDDFVALIAELWPGSYVINQRNYEDVADIYFGIS